MKKCRKCHILKNLSGFSKDAVNKDGYRICCKNCESLIRRERAEKRGVKVFVYRKNDKENHKTCSSCKKELPNTEFNKSSAIKDGLQGKCKQCSKHYYKKINSKLRNRSKILCTTYKKIDLKKGIINDLTTDFLFDNILTKSCYYCGDSEVNIGCDRIDNSSGHFISNVVPCCCICNRVKSNIFSKEEMINLGKIIKEIKQKRKQLGK